MADNLMFIQRWEGKDIVDKSTGWTKIDISTDESVYALDVSY